MKKILAGSLASALLICSTAYVALANENPTAAENAQVTLTVTKFRSITSLADHGYVDATTALAPHASVTLVDEDGMATHRVKRAVNIEITVGSADASESYTPLGILFQQRVDGAAVKKDPDGATNFDQWRSDNGTVVMRHKFINKGRDGHYEFFVVIQRASDGEIGIIDPDIETENAEN